MKSLFTLSIILSYCTFSFAQIGGNNTYEFLNLSTSARTIALGGNTITLKEGDLGIAYQNSALLTKASDNQLSFNSGFGLAGTQNGYLSFGKDLDSAGTIAIGLQYANYGNIQGADATGLKTGTFYAGEYAAHLSWSKQYSQTLSYGANLKIITSFLESYFSLGIAIDIGGNYYNAEKEISASIVIKNIGYQFISSVKGNREPLPFEIQAGFSKKLNHLPFRFSIIAHSLQRANIRYDDPNQAKVTNLFDADSTAIVKEKKYIVDKIFRHLIFGGEFLISENFNIRFGYNHIRRQELIIDTRKGLAGFSGGFGLKIKRYQIDYGFAIYHLASTTHFISLSTNLSEFGKKGI